MNFRRTLLFASAFLLLTACSLQIDRHEKTDAPLNTSTSDIPHGSRPTRHQAQPASCSTTVRPESPFVPPKPYPAIPPDAYIDHYWFGTSELWTMLKDDGAWGFPGQDGPPYPQKILWFREEYDPHAEPKPDLEVTANQYNLTGEAISAEGATNAIADFGPAMLTGLNFPSSGCWEISGRYGDQELRFVVWVSP
jgi:hypothetical protein